MNVLIACEFSGIVRDAFNARGHNAWSVDLLPSESEIGGGHYEGDALWYIDKEWQQSCVGWDWDMMIAFPPCTHLAVSGARWFKEKIADGRQQQAIAFFMSLVNAPIEKIAIENPIGIMSTQYRKPDQIIQPWQYGHGETKATCLWLKGLPKLEPTNIVEGRESRIHNMPPSEDRSKLRSITYQGVADAMAEQWS